MLAKLASLLPIDVLSYLLIAIFVLAGLAVWLAASVERLHDRDKSAWFLFLFFGIPTLISNIETAREGFTNFSFFYGGTGSALSIIAGIISVWMVVELGLLRGTAGPNRYGPDPLQEAAEQQSA